MEIESILTQLVFEHSLRIRLRSNALDDKDDSENKGKKNFNVGESGQVSTHGTGTPSASRGDGEQETEDAGGLAESGPDGGHSKEKTGHLVGKINNLITSDISGLSSSFDVVDVRECNYRRLWVCGLRVSSCIGPADCNCCLVPVRSLGMEVS